MRETESVKSKRERERERETETEIDIHTFTPFFSKRVRYTQREIALHLVDY